MLLATESKCSQSEHTEGICPKSTLVPEHPEWKAVGLRARSTVKTVLHLLGSTDLLCFAMSMPSLDSGEDTEGRPRGWLTSKDVKEAF